MVTITSTQLDFNNIKNKLKTFLAQQPEFTDYNFEASGLSNILDVLAYNTHFNGLIANFALNESFLNTAQLRSSVVSHAESLGYTPRSRTAAIAYITVSITNTNPGRSSTATLPAGTRFTAPVDGIQYTFQTTESFTAPDDGNGVYTFLSSTGTTSIPIYEGTPTTKTFYVGETTERQLYVIPDTNIDTTTLNVKVFNSATSSVFTQYTDLDRAASVTPSSTYYDIHEAPNGFYELHFGDGIVTGIAPVAGNKVVLNYLTTLGPDANRASVFTPINTITMDGSQYTLNVITTVVATGGAEKEDLESIRQNAPISFASQQRLVTANDYKGLILANYASVRDCSAWGGEDNDPPEYGKALVSLKFADGVDSAAQQTIKDSIVNNLTDNLSIMSIDTKFVDPEFAYIGCGATFNYNPNLSTTPINLVETQVVATIQRYFDDNLEVFDGVFRRSNLLTLIDNISPAVLNSRIDVTIQRRFTPTLNVSNSYTVLFPVAIASPDNVQFKINTNIFTYQGQICTIKNALNSTKLQVVNSAGVVIVDNIGSYTPSTGRVSLVGFEPTAISSGTQISVSAVPANQATVKPLRNYILELDASNTFARGELDYQTTRSTL